MFWVVPYVDHYTDSNGEYTISLDSFSDCHNQNKIENIDIKFYSKNRITNAKDGARLNYPYIYNIPNNIAQFGYNPIVRDLNITYATMNQLIIF